MKKRAVNAGDRRFEGCCTGELTGGALTDISKDTKNSDVEGAAPCVPFPGTASGSS